MLWLAGELSSGETGVEVVGTVVGDGGGGWLLGSATGWCLLAVTVRATGNGCAARQEAGRAASGGHAQGIRRGWAQKQCQQDAKKLAVLVRRQ